jgi:hypothetical protein
MMLDGGKELELILKGQQSRLMCTGKTWLSNKKSVLEEA